MMDVKNESGAMDTVITSLYIYLQDETSDNQVKALLDMVCEVNVYG
jgi:hypothetical protein